MERKHFLATAGLLGAMVGTAGIASGANFPIAGATPYPSPYPSGSPHPLRRRGERNSLHDLEHADRTITRVIDRLQRDQTDFGGHRVAAIADLQRAQGEIQAAIQYDGTHPNSTTTNPGINPSIPNTNQLNTGPNPFRNP